MFIKETVAEFGSETVFIGVGLPQWVTCGSDNPNVLIMNTDRIPPLPTDLTFILRPGHDENPFG